MGNNMTNKAGIRRKLQFINCSKILDGDTDAGWSDNY